MPKKLKSSHKRFKKEEKEKLYQGLNPKKTKIPSKLSHLEELSEHLHLPADMLAGAPVITATGRNEVNLENYKSIIEFNVNQITIQAKTCRICIEGKKLNILYFTEDEMRITGFIEAIYYK